MSDSRSASGGASLERGNGAGERDERSTERVEAHTERVERSTCWMVPPTCLGERACRVDGGPIRANRGAPPCQGGRLPGFLLQKGSSRKDQRIKANSLRRPRDGRATRTA